MHNSRFRDFLMLKIFLSEDYFQRHPCFAKMICASEKLDKEYSHKSQRLHLPIPQVQHKTVWHIVNSCFIFITHNKNFTDGALKNVIAETLTEQLEEINTPAYTSRTTLRCHLVFHTNVEQEDLLVHRSRTICGSSLWRPLI